LLGQIRGHFHVQNKFDEFEDFTQKVVKSKESYPAKQLIEMMKKREQDFKAEADKFINSVPNEPIPMLGDLR
jgi:hypothetical protein